MSGCIHETVVSANWKMKHLLRVRTFYTDREMVNLYKAHILSFIEYRTSAIFHASYTTLLPLDLIQNRFLRELGISVEDAAIHLKLLPLRIRRQIAVLGIIKRAQLRRGPPQFWNWFQNDTFSGYSSTIKHTRPIRQVVHHQAPQYLRRSILGMIKIYNWLPQRIVDRATVKEFQSELQLMIIDAVTCQHN